MNKKWMFVAGLAASTLLASAQTGTVIYENASTLVKDGDGIPFRSQLSTGATEIGDQVTFAGTDRNLTGFQFEYFSSSDIQVQVFLRSLNSEGRPGAVLYDSGLVTLTAGYHTAVAEGLHLEVPDSIVWSVDFRGASEAGLLFYNPGGPDVGSSPTSLDSENNAFDFHWQNTATGWALFDTPSVVDNFGASFTAVPEPTTWALMLGGLGLFGFLGFRRKA